MIKHLEADIKNGGNIVEYHDCGFFPEHWFKVVYVVRCNNTLLYDRLVARGYNQAKLKNNIECEIFQTILIDAQDSYEEGIVKELSGETDADFDESIKKIVEFVKNYKQ